MNEKERIEILERALKREKAARKTTERLLEEKSTELYEISLEQKKSKEKLERLLIEKTSELEGVFLNINDAYIVVDLLGNVLKMNKTAISLLGHDIANSPLNLLDLVQEDYLNYTMGAFKKLLEGGTFTNYIAQITTVDQKSKKVQVNASIIYNAKGKPIGAQGVARDVTRELQISDLIETQKKQMDLVIDNSPIGIMLATGKDQKVILANEAICTLLEYSEAELQKMQIKDYTHPDDREDTKVALEQMKNGLRDKIAVEKRYLTKSGKTIWARTTVSAIKDSRGNLAYLLRTIEDVTQEKVAKERLVRSENRLASLVLNLQTGILLEDEYGKVVLTNKMFCDLFGIEAPPEALIGMNCSEAAEAACILFKDPKGFIEGIKQLLEQKSPFLKEELELANGAFYERSYIPIYHEGSYQGRLWTYEDISEQKNLVHQKEVLLKSLAEQNEHLNEYAHMVSHDLKSPLRNISALVSWTKEELLGKLGEESVQNLDLIQGKIEKMDRLIEDILNYSSMERDKAHSERIYLKDLVDEVLEMIFVPEHIEVVVDESLPVIKGDTTKIQQLFQNLLSNAANYIDKPKGKIHIGYQDNGAYHQFFIQDNGVGIKEEDFDKIFKVFKTLGNNEKSTGIGLSIVKKVIELYEGEIWLESEYGIGTTFFFTLKK